jgi:membrane peptidoglycan carboxypeptidase
VADHRITDQKGKVLVETQPPLLNESMRAIDARNAFVMDRLLKEVARSGTAASASRTSSARPVRQDRHHQRLDRHLVQRLPPVLVAIVWMGYDNPRPLGDRETGGGLSLPVWINFMETALKGVPVMVPTAPEGVVNIGGEWFYEEYARGGGVSSLGVTPVAQGEPAAHQRHAGRRARGPASRHPPLGPACHRRRTACRRRRRRARPTTAAASWTCSGTGALSSGAEVQRSPACCAGVAGEVLEELALPLGVHPANAVELVMEAAGRAASHTSCSGFCRLTMIWLPLRRSA